MKKFTTRVELHNEAAEDTDIYQYLHSEMENAGFSRTVTGNDNKEYHLPDAEYYISAADTIEETDIRKKAIDATVKAIQDNTKIKLPKAEKHYSILVTGHSKLAWIGLKLVE